MDINREIQIIDCLRLREEQFRLVWQLEESVRELLNGAALPFPAPPCLLSLQQRVRKGSGQTKALPRTERPGPALPLRALQGGRENAYRVRYVFKGEEKESFQRDADFLQTLPELTGEHFRLLQIETVAWRSEGEFQVMEELWRYNNA